MRRRAFSKGAPSWSGNDPGSPGITPMVSVRLPRGSSPGPLPTARPWPAALISAIARFRPNGRPDCQHSLETGPTEPGVEDRTYALCSRGLDPARAWRPLRRFVARRETAGRMGRAAGSGVPVGAGSGCRGGSRRAVPRSLVWTWSGRPRDGGPAATDPTEITPS